MANKNATVNIGLQITDTIGFNLQLAQSNITASNYILTTQTPLGKLTTKPDFACFYKGKVNDIDGGDVRLTIKDGFIYGYIKKGDKEYFIDPLNRFDKYLPKDEFIFYEGKDVVGNSMACGFNDLLNTAENIKNDTYYNSGTTSSDSLQNTICKKVKLLIATDYSMFKAFNNDNNALQTFLLANLNMAEGLFNTLNLDSTISGDTGTDFLKFEVTQIHTSVCDSCDFLNNTDNALLIASAFGNWITKNTASNPAIVNQFWSTRNLHISSPSAYILGYSNTIGIGTDCNVTRVNLIKYFTQDAITLRLQITHEAGHILGCQHDNSISSSVTGFIMNSAGTYSSTGRFSRLSDFGGINYSSQLAIRSTILQSSCIEDCSSQNCETATVLKINYYNSSDSVKVSWAGSGKYILKYKIKDTVNYDPANVFTVSDNEIILKNLTPCTNYTLQVQKICSLNISGAISSINFNSSPFDVKVNTANIRGDVYDLKLQLECNNCVAKTVTVNIDHRPYTFTINKFPSTVTIPNLFADGARHRLDYSGDNINGGCKLLHFYRAPYYREKSVKIINENFDSCKLSAQWKDSTLKIIPNFNTPWQWGSAKLSRDLSSVDDLFFYPGNIDTTCMIFNYNGVGSQALVSSKLDISKFKSIYLSFDYKYVCYKPAQFTNTVNTFFKVQVFNGTTWLDVLEKNEVEIRKSGRRIIWDTLPPRIFINLDKYINDKFQFRFIIDDGAVTNPGTGSLERALPFLYLDNILVDGYNKASNTEENKFSIFPNPTTTDLFIKITPAIAANIQYKIMDVSGRLIQQEKLTNYRINVSKFSSGIYFLVLYKKNEQFGELEKFFKY